MAKKKNHTNHNQNRKNHRNGIKKVKRTNKPDFSGLNKKIMLNNYYSTLHQQTGGRVETSDEQ